jgi:hypothetical protein
MEVVGAPIDVRIEFGEPGLSEDEVIFFEWVEEGLQVVGIGVAGKLNGNGVFGEGRGAVGEDDGDG